MMARNANARVRKDEHADKHFYERKRRILAALYNVDDDAVCAPAAACAHTPRANDCAATPSDDRSPKGSVDRKCALLLDLLNRHDDYVTTSSCSGRIALFHSIDTDPHCADKCQALAGTPLTTCAPNTSIDGHDQDDDNDDGDTDEDGRMTQQALRGSNVLQTSEVSNASARSHTEKTTCGATTTNSSSSICRKDDAECGRRRMKRGASHALGWLYVKHGALRAHEMQTIVDFICGTASEAGVHATTLDAEQQALCSHHETAATTAASQNDAHCVADTMCAAYDGEVDGILHVTPQQCKETMTVTTTSDAERARLWRQLLSCSGSTVCLKVEPLVLHVQCRTLTAAQQLHAAAVADSGYRNSGITPPGRRIMCAIRATAGHGLDVPLVLDGVNHMAGQRAYMWSLLHLANRKMIENERRSALLTRNVAVRIAMLGPVKTQIQQANNGAESIRTTKCAQQAGVHQKTN